MSDTLKLSQLAGDAEADKIANAKALADSKQRIKELQQTNAKLERLLAEKNKINQQAASKPAAPEKKPKPANRIAARKQDNFKAVSNTPDVCKTPVGSSCAPMPYNVVSDLSESMGCVPTVNFNCHPAYVLQQSIVPTCTGDEPGSATGIASGTVGGETVPCLGSSTVNVGKHPVIRDGDPCTMNSGNCTGVFVTTPTSNGSIDADGSPSEDTNPAPELSEKQEAAAEQELGVLGQVWGGVVGAAEGVWDMGKGLYHVAETLNKFTALQVVMHPEAAIEAATSIAQTSAKIYDNPSLLLDGISKPYTEAWNSGQYGKAIGRGVVDVGSLFLGGVGAAGKAGEAGGVVSKVGKLGEIGETTSNVGRLAEGAQTASRLGEGAEVANSARAASETADAARVGGETADAAPRSIGNHRCEPR